MHAFASCTTSPTGECDWGTRSGTYNGSPFIINFNHDNQTDLLTISLNGPRLQVVDVGSSGTNTYMLKKV